jgi:hypothetical protein
MLVIDHAFLEENILHSGCSPNTEPQYLQYVLFVWTIFLILSTC